MANEEFVCPLQQPQAEQVQEAPTQACDDEMVLFGYSFKGVRTYSIVLLIMLVYSILVLRIGSLNGIQELALLACGYMFGTKVANRR